MKTPSKDRNSDKRISRVRRKFKIRRYDRGELAQGLLDNWTCLSGTEVSTNPK